MIILVTGVAGFIGSAVVRLAIARGHTVGNVVIGQSWLWAGS